MSVYLTNSAMRKTGILKRNFLSMSGMSMCVVSTSGSIQARGGPVWGKMPTLWGSLDK